MAAVKRSARTTAGARTLARWTAIPGGLRRALAGISRRDLALRGGADGRSVGEYAHHLVEANLVAASIVLAAVGSPDGEGEYDWAWLVPDEAWMRRLGYRRLPVEPALALLDALCIHLAAVLGGSPEALRRSVALRGSTGVERRTVEEILRAECEHAEQHLRDIRAVRSAAARGRR